MTRNAVELQRMDTLRQSLDRLQIFDTHTGSFQTFQQRPCSFGRIFSSSGGEVPAGQAVWQCADGGKFIDRKLTVAEL